MEALTKRQLEVLVAIRTLTARLGYPPTLMELGHHVGIGSSNGVIEHLRALERKGWIRRDARLSRGIRIVSQKAPLDDSDSTQAARLEQKRIACLALADQLRGMIDSASPQGRLITALVAGLQPDAEAAA